jgi:hypothetical protein
MNYSEMLKAELIAECEKRGLDTSGTKAELTARLEANDAESASNEAKTPAPVKRQKRRVFNSMLHRYEYK